MELNTFTIVGRCARTGMLGVAVCTAAPAVGGYCPFVRARAGAVATMSWVNPYLAIDGLKLMADGVSAKDALDRLIAEDPGRAVRQVGMVDAAGGSAAFTGEGLRPLVRPPPRREFFRPGQHPGGRRHGDRDGARPSGTPRRWRCPSACCSRWRQARRPAATRAASSRRRCWSTGRRNTHTSTCAPTSTATRWRSCGGSTRWPSTRACRSSRRCRRGTIRWAASATRSRPA